MWNFESLEEANNYLEDIDKVQIERYDKKKGKRIKKDYVMVKDKVAAFRKVCPAGIIQSSIVSCNDDSVIFCTEVYDDDENLLATGHAWERRESSDINKTSYIENAETSSIGRALSNLGIGIKDSYSTYEEVLNADEQELEGRKKASAESIKQIKVDCEIYEVDISMIEDFLEHPIDSSTNAEIETIKDYIKKLNKKK